MHPIQPADVGDFMRVADRGHRAVNQRLACKFIRRQHRAFDVDMGIDKSRKDVSAGVGARLRRDGGDAPLGPSDSSGEDCAVYGIDDGAV